MGTSPAVGLAGGRSGADVAGEQERICRADEPDGQSPVGDCRAEEAAEGQAETD